MSRERIVTELPLAAYLILKGFQQQPPKYREGQTHFAFEDSAELQAAISAYYNRKGFVDALTHTEQVRILKSLASQMRRNASVGGGDNE